MQTISCQVCKNVNKAQKFTSSFTKSTCKRKELYAATCVSAIAKFYRNWFHRGCLYNINRRTQTLRFLLMGKCTGGKRLVSALPHLNIKQKAFCLTLYLVLLSRFLFCYFFIQDLLYYDHRLVTS